MGNVDQVMFGLSWERQLPSLGEQSLWHSLNTNPDTLEEKPSYYDIFKIHLNSGKPSFYLGCVIGQRKVEMGSAIFSCATTVHLLKWLLSLPGVAFPLYPDIHSKIFPSTCAFSHVKQTKLLVSWHVM